MKRLLNLLLILTALIAPARGEEYAALSQLKEQAPLVWEGAYENEAGERVQGNASVILHQGDQMPVLRLQRRATQRTWRDKTEQTGYYDFFYVITQREAGQGVSRPVRMVTGWIAANSERANTSEGLRIYLQLGGDMAFLSTHEPARCWTGFR